MMEDMRAARHSIHLQYFIWGADEFTERLKEILTTKARAGVEVRLLYDPLGSRAHLSRALCQGHDGGGGSDGTHVAPVPAPYDQLPQPPQDHPDRWAGRLCRRHEHRPRAPQRRQGIRLLARHPAAHRGGRRRGAPGGVHGRLVQRRQGGSVCPGILPDRRDRAHRRRRPGPDPDVGAGFPMGGDPPALLLR